VYYSKKSGNRYLPVMATCQYNTAHCASCGDGNSCQDFPIVSCEALHHMCKVVQIGLMECLFALPSEGIPEEAMRTDCMQDSLLSLDNRITL